MAILSSWVTFLMLIMSTILYSNQRGRMKMVAHKKTASDCAMPELRKELKQLILFPRSIIISKHLFTARTTVMSIDAVMKMYKAG